MLHGEAHVVNSQLTLRVVNRKSAAGRLLRSVDVLLEPCLHLTVALIAATAGLHVNSLLLLGVRLKVYWLLANGKHLLILHFIVFVEGDQFCFHVVLDFRFGFLAPLLVFEVEARRQALLQLKLKVDYVVAWHELVIRNLENALFVVCKLLLLLALFRFFLCVALFIRFEPKSLEGSFLLPFGLNLNVRSGDRLKNLKVDLAVDYVARLVEGKLALDEDVALRILATLVVKEHKIF